MSQLDDEQRRIQEHKELLKMKQGLIEESEMIPETGYAEIEELHGWKRVENFVYHHKVALIVGLFAALVIGFMIYQTVTREKEDLYILAISTMDSSGIYTKTSDIERAFEMYCPDFDENGYVHVAVNFINLSTEHGWSQATDADRYKFVAEVITGDSQIFLADIGVIDEINEASTEIQFFADLSEKYPDAVLYDGVGLQLNTTEWKSSARWESCPDINCLFIREEFEDMTGDGDEAVEQRRRALILLDNIINGNIVNPPEE